MLSLFQNAVFIGQGSGWADFDTGSTEAAIGVGERFIESSTYMGLFAPVYKRQNPHPSEFIAGSDAASAEDAFAHIMSEKGI
jgi:hypothetical protein